MPEFTGGMIKEATAIGDLYGKPQVSIKFTAEGREKFAEVTRRLTEEGQRTGRLQRVAILIGGKLCSAPVVQGEITGGSAMITGNFTEREVSELVNLLNNPLQARLQVVEERAFGP